MGGRALSPFVVSKCSCPSIVFSRGVPRLIARAWGDVPRKDNLTLALFLLLFSCAVSWHFLPGPVRPVIAWAVLGSVVEILELGMKGENIPSSSTQCLLLDPVPAGCDLFGEAGRGPRGRVDGEAMSPDSAWWP